MTWQDITLTIVCAVFAISLVPQIIHNFQNKTGSITYHTSVPTCIGSYIITVVYASLGLTFSAVTCFMSGTCWLIFIIQRLAYNKKIPT